MLNICWEIDCFWFHTIILCHILYLKGRRTKEEDTGFIIHKLAKFLEVCLDEWLSYISEKRNTYLHLNYFTIDQLVQLQRELVKIGTEEEPSLMIYPLLSAVKKDCTASDLNEALRQGQDQLNQVIFKHIYWRSFVGYGNLNAFFFLFSNIRYWNTCIIFNARVYYLYFDDQTDWGRVYLSCAC